MVASQTTQLVGNLKHDLQKNFKTTAAVGLCELNFETFSDTTQKVKVLFEKLVQLRQRQDEQSHSLSLLPVGSDDCIGGNDRDSAVTTIKSMHRFYNYSCDTLAAAVCILDRFISKVKVKPRYLSCVTASAFFLSTKLSEESEHHPSATDLTSLHRHAWTTSDLKRMEKVILDKLKWNLFPSVSCLAFLQIIYRMLTIVIQDIDQQFMVTLVKRSELYMNYSSCARFNACTLAVCIVDQCLKEAGLSSLVTQYIQLHVQSACQIMDSEVLECQSAITKTLHIYNLDPLTQPRCLTIPKLVPRPSLVKRPSFYGSTDLPTIEEVHWSSETSEEEKLEQSSCIPYTYAQVVSFVPFVKYPEQKKAQSYCLTLDQCFFETTGKFVCNYQCNIIDY